MRSCEAPAKEAEAARAQLEAALRSVGIILPSLSTDTGECVGRTIALVDLGRCNVATARRLVSALSEVSQHGAS
ncbi:hypothetical protein GTY53_24575 [Streptomyces sp. SID7805]|nr:hypothetical protein [Streptomyces sp. SID7805]MYU55054.1 hypothetical protein [Streptomyces sp. SID7805]